MNLEKLKKLLESGAITQEEFDEMAKMYQPETDEKDEEGEDTEEDGEEDDHEEEEQLDRNAQIAKEVQRQVDRIANKLGNENKRLKDQLNDERRKHLSAAELKKLEIEEKEKELLEKEQELLTKSNRMYAVKALKKAKLDDGSEETLELLDLVSGDSEDAIDSKVAALQKYVQSLVGKKVDDIFKKNGRTPGKGTEGGGVKNPYKTGNLTEQMKLEMEDPELAAKLKASAGA